MGYERITLKIVALDCARGHQATQKELEAALGRCRLCRGERFHVVLERKTSFFEEGDPSGAAVAGAAAQILVAGVAVVPGGRFGNQRAEIELFDIDGRELLRRMRKPGEEAAAWAHEVRLAHSKAHLKPDQKICAACGCVFTPPKYGPTRDDFCSPKCRASSIAVDPVPAVSRRADVACPHCGKVLRLRGTVLGKTVCCSACSRKFTPPGPSSGAP